MKAKQIEQAGPDATSTPGCTSETGNSIWTRSLKNQPANEEQLRNTPLRIDCEVYGMLSFFYGKERVDERIRVTGEVVVV